MKASTSTAAGLLALLLLGPAEQTSKRADPLSSALSSETVANIMSAVALERLSPSDIHQLALQGRLHQATTGLHQLLSRANVAPMFAGARPEQLAERYKDRKKIDCAKLLDLRDSTLRTDAHVMRVGLGTFPQGTAMVTPLEDLAAHVAQVRFMVCSAYRTDWRIPGSALIGFEMNLTKLTLKYRSLAQLATDIAARRTKQAVESDLARFQAEADSVYVVFVEFLESARQIRTAPRTTP